MSDSVNSAVLVVLGVADSVNSVVPVVLGVADSVNSVVSVRAAEDLKLPWT